MRNRLNWGPWLGSTYLGDLDGAKTIPAEIPGPLDLTPRPMFYPLNGVGPYVLPLEWGRALCFTP